jgi:hypothetical protein
VPSGLLQRQHLGVCRGIRQDFALIVPAADNRAIENHHRTDRYLPAGQCLARLVQRLLHESGVIGNLRSIARNRCHVDP